MTGAQFTPDASADLREIHDYIGRDNASGAGRLVDLLEQTCDTLAENPHMGRARLKVYRNRSAGRCRVAR